MDRYLETNSTGESLPIRKSAEDISGRDNDRSLKSVPSMPSMPLAPPLASLIPTTPRKIVSRKLGADDTRGSPQFKLDSSNLPRVDIDKESDIEDTAVMRSSIGSLTSATSSTRIHRNHLGHQGIEAEPSASTTLSSSSKNSIK